MTSSVSDLTLRYEIFPESDGWCWRCVAATGEVIARSLRPMTQEGCRTVVSSLRSTLAGPVICMAE